MYRKSESERWKEEVSSYRKLTLQEDEIVIHTEVTKESQIFPGEEQGHMLAERKLMSGSTYEMARRRGAAVETERSQSDWRRILTKP